MSAGAAAEWIVLKFGGASVSSLPNWRNIVAVVRERRASGARTPIMQSAFSGVTDQLDKLLDASAELGQQLHEIALAGKFTHRSRAYVLAYGGLLASELGAEVPRAQGIECAWWDAHEGLQSQVRAHASAGPSFLNPPNP